ncbi:helix-turn-helix transcriptional regulator, partial [Salmonella enterica]|nr:helix-turn-helix transcriptional regulator [Salmonella enterica]
MKDSIYNHVLRWTEENLNTGRRVENLIATTGYSRRTVELWFAEKTGMTPGVYLQRRRISRICVLLRMTSFSVTEIADLFHYSSSQNLARAFKKQTGFTPTEYRSSEDWDCSPLQASLLISEKNIINTGVRFLGRRVFHGDWMNYWENVFNPESDKVLNIIKKNLNKISKGIAIIANISDNSQIDERKRSERVKVRMLIDIPERKSQQNETIVSSGYYYMVA